MFALILLIFRIIHNSVGFEIPIRIVAQVAGNGNALAEPCTMTNSCGILNEKKSALHWRI